MTLTFTQGHNCVSELTNALTCTLIVISSDDLDLDKRSLWVGKGKKMCCMLSATKQAISIKLATTVGDFYVTLTLTLQTFVWLVQLVFFLLLVNSKLAYPWFELTEDYVPRSRAYILHWLAINCHN